MEKHAEPALESGLRHFVPKAVPYGVPRPSLVLWAFLLNTGCCIAIDISVNPEFRSGSPGKQWQLSHALM